MLNGWTPIIIEWALTLLSLIFVLLRIHVRFSVPTTDVHYKLSDAIVVVAWLALAVMVALDTMLAKLSLFNDPGQFDGSLTTKNEKPEDNVRMMKIFYGSVFPYTVSIYLVKAALLTWYYTMTPKTLPRCLSALQIISGLCAIGFFVAIGFNFLWCWPVSRNWTLDGPRVCIAAAQLPTVIVTLVFHALTNIMIFVYPFPLMRSARLVRQSRQTWGIAFLFALGFVAIASTVARVAATFTNATTTVVAVWTTGECATGIIIVCCPALRLLIQSSTPATRLHHKSGSPPPVQHHGASTDTYVSTTHTVRTTLAASEIWDGTDNTAPEWIRLSSRGMTYGSGGAVYSAKDIEMGSYVPTSAEAPDKTAMAGGRYGHAHPRAPGFVLQPGRGIIQHAPLAASAGGVPSWMDLPDPPFLSEKDEEDDRGHAQKLKAPPPPPASKSKVRWEVEDADDDGEKKWDDGNVLESRDRWEALYPRASERLDRIVETLSEPAAATKRWSQGSFGDRAGRRREEEEDEKKVIRKETSFD